MPHAQMSRRMDRSTVPQSVIDQPLRTLQLLALDSEVVVYLREADFRLRTMSRNCAAQVRLGAWDIGEVKVVVFALRLDHNDAMTFEYWLNVGEPAGVRVLQCLAAQKTIDVVVVGEEDTRFYRVPSTGAHIASRIVKQIRRQGAWSEAAFRQATTRVSQLYPSASAMWQALREFVD